MLLVEDDVVPVLFAHPLVLGLDAAVAPAPQEVLERFETHDGAGLVGRLGLVPLRLLRFEPAACVPSFSPSMHRPFYPMGRHRERLPNLMDSG